MTVEATGFSPWNKAGPEGPFLAAAGPPVEALHAGAGARSMDEPLTRLLAAARQAGLADRIAPLTEGETWFPTGSTTVQSPQPSATTQTIQRPIKTSN